MKKIFSILIMFTLFFSVLNFSGAEEKKIKNYTDYSTRPITDFINIDDKLGFENVHISGSGEFPIKCNDFTIVGIEKGQYPKGIFKYDNKNNYLKVKIKSDDPKEDFTFLRTFYLKEGIKKAGVFNSLGVYESSTGNIIRSTPNADGTYYIYFDISNVYEKNNQLSLKECDYIMFSFYGENYIEKAILFDNPLKNK